MIHNFQIFNQFDVILSRVPASHINEINKEGVVFIFKKQNSYFLEWRANENVENGLTEIAISAMEDAGEEWSIINQITYKSAGDSIGMTGPKMKNLRIALSDVKQFKLKVISISFNLSFSILIDFYLLEPRVTSVQSR